MTLKESIEVQNLTIIQDLKDFLLVKNNYGICRVSKENLKRGRNPSIKSAINKNDYFKNQIIAQFPDYFDDKVMLGNYIGGTTEILFQTNYGLHNMTPVHILCGYNFSILSAINKTEYFKSILFEKYPDYTLTYTIISNYIAAKKEVFVNTKYGICKLTPDDLIHGTSPNIRSAIDKTEYFINQAREIHKDTYDYSLVEYVNAKSKVLIICDIHDIFEQTPSGHLNKKGCLRCGRSKGLWKDREWINSAKKSKRFDSFKVYVIRCWNDEEEFYKIGKTYLKINQRYPSKLTMPYNYEIIEETTSIDGKEICELERKLIKFNVKNSYSPLIKFGGSKTECFSYIVTNTCS